ncbi:MAG: imidazole glycerol phosphate synthase subunit HisH [Alphaproteobacteria bacterium]|nr:imidazole glycerol phosphate synthase subunit HisH [Alphaproteobacteria bacterium]
MTTAIIDYGSGNLRSVAKAFERATSDVGVGGDVVVTDKAEQVAAADRIVLPGVGAFADCRAGLFAVPGMTDALEAAVIKNGRPFLGICVGMQLLAKVGFEHGEHTGLGWVDGEVVELTPGDLKVPHMGWNNLTIRAPDHPVLAGINTGDHAYFVHSFELRCANDRDVLATTEYGDTLVAAAGHDNVFGTQFHPEKSQAIGLRLIANFLQWKP